MLDFDQYVSFIFNLLLVLLLFFFLPVVWKSDTFNRVKFVSTPFLNQVDLREATYSDHLDKIKIAKVNIFVPHLVF